MNKTASSTIPVATTEGVPKMQSDLDSRVKSSSLVKFRLAFITLLLSFGLATMAHAQQEVKSIETANVGSKGLNKDKPTVPSANITKAAASSNEVPVSELSLSPLADQASIAKINGQELTIGQFKTFLLQRAGQEHLDDFINRELLKAEASRLKISIDYESVSQAVSSRLEYLANAITPEGKDSVQELNKALIKRGSSIEYYRRWLREKTIWDMALKQCIAKDRSISEKELYEFFEKEYGKDGLRIKFQQIVISSEGDYSGSPKPLRAARALMKRIRAGEEFNKLAIEYSIDRKTAGYGGVAKDYVAGQYGNPFHHILTSLFTPGELHLIQSDLGIHVVQLIERKQFVYESVKDELHKKLYSAPADSNEKVRFFKKLRSAAKISLSGLNSK